MRNANPAAIAVMSIVPLVSALAGCSYESSDYIGDREVSARTSSLNGTSACTTGTSVQLVVAVRAFNVDERQITWGPDHVLQLPDGWNKLELVQSGRYVIVRVDGREYHKIDPSA
jgi:hypothetical protein